MAVTTITYHASSHEMEGTTTMVSKLTCPHCEHTASTSKTIPPGAKIKCPSCNQTFVPVPAEVLVTAVP